MIDNLSDQEKSVMLARAMGWRIRKVLTNPIESGWARAKPKYFDVFDFVDDEGYVHERYDLYDPANMALAWRVLNWAYESDVTWIKTYDSGTKAEHNLSGHAESILNNWIFNHDTEESIPLVSFEPGDAQRYWLDKILELAIEAGIVELDRETGYNREED